MKSSRRDVLEGIAGAMGILLDLGTPFLRSYRSRWGLTAAEAAHAYPGDAIVEKPAWMWTHAVEIAAPPEKVWPWVAQIGQGKGGFYSYQWLENLVGCEVENADAVHARWTHVARGDELRLHPQAPPLIVEEVQPGRFFVVCAPRGKAVVPMQASWLLQVEPHGAGARFVSRYRIAYDGDLRTRLMFGPWTMESVGFVMDRRMLLGVKERAERQGFVGASAGSFSL